MKKSGKKKLLALLCTVAMLFSITNVMPVEAGANLDQDMTMLTFSKFGIANGSYDNNDPTTGLAFAGEYNKTLDKTAFSGDVVFSDQEVAFQYGFQADTWHCIRFRFLGDGSVVLHNTFTGQDLVTMTSDIAGVEFVDKKFNLTISTEFVDVDTDDDSDKDDIKLGVWFNNKLYNEQYFYLEDIATQIGQYISLDMCQSTKPVQVYSVALNEKQESLGKHLKGITLKNFDIADGKYKRTQLSDQMGFEVNGGYAFSLDNTYFSADVEFSSLRGADLRFGGNDDPWLGLVFDVMGDGIRMYDALFNEDEGDQIYYFNSSLAGVKLLDNRFNLKLSTEYVDCDQDGAKDDVKLGVWFNNVLYNNEYIYLPNYALEMGSGLTICASEEAPESYVAIYTDTSLIPKVDFTIFGFTDNWDKELGKEM